MSGSSRGWKTATTTRKPVARGAAEVDVARRALAARCRALLRGHAARVLAAGASQRPRSRPWLPGARCGKLRETQFLNDLRRCGDSARSIPDALETIARHLDEPTGPSAKPLQLQADDPETARKWYRALSECASWRGVGAGRARPSEITPIAFLPRVPRGVNMADRYCSYDELRAAEAPDAFTITVTDRNTTAVIVAPHGGKIEPGTTQIATAVP